MMKCVDKEIFRLSLPAIISNVTVPLLGLCDTAISGHLGSEIFLAAIAVGSVMLNVVFWLFGFLRAGTTGLTAKAFGAHNEEMIRRVFSRALALALVGGFLVILIRLPLMDLLFNIIHAEEEVVCYVTRYFSICIWGAPAVLGVMTVSGWFVGMQSTLYPMAVAITVNVINIVLSFTLAFVMEMGFEGVAWGTLCSNWIGLMLAFGCVLWFRRGKGIWCGWKALIEGGLWRFFSVNINLFFRSACIIGVSLGVASAGARLGALTLAVNVIVMQLFQFFSFFMDGFAYSAEAMVGKYAGRKDRYGMDMTVNALLRWTLVMSLLFAIAYGLFCGGIASILTDQVNVIEEVKTLRIWIMLIPFVSAWAFIYDGFYIGITNTHKMMVVTLVSTIVFYIIAFLHYEDGVIVAGVTDNRLLWSSFLCYLFLRGALLASQWKKTQKFLI